MRTLPRVGALSTLLLLACSGSTDSTTADAGPDAAGLPDSTAVDTPTPVDRPPPDAGPRDSAVADVFDAADAPDVADASDPDAAVDAASPDDVADAAPSDDQPSTADSTTTCGVGRTACGDSCIDLQRDSAHCGACGVACIANESCDEGRCVLRCPTGQRNCSGVCRDIAVDPTHCGACDSACATGELCSGGVCQLTCSAGLTRCGDRCRDVQHDPAHCGACNNACTAGRRCVDGACLSPCAAGLTLCGGACLDTRTSTAHCGACDTACRAGQSCVEGACLLVCPMGQTACGDACVTLTSSDAHCGECNNACTEGQRCIAGACAVPTLPPFAVPVFDHDVAMDGSVAMIGQQSNTILLRCLDGSGVPRRADQTVVSSPNLDLSGNATQVHIAPRAGTVLVTWMALQTAGNHSTRQFFARVYDASCAPVTNAFTWPSPAGSEYIPDVAMTDDGRFVVAWKAPDIELAFFSPQGVLQGRLVAPTRSVCSGGGYGHHVALNPTTGDGVLSCQQHQSHPIYYQRFSANRTLRDPMPVRIEESTNNRSSWYESHILGMNATGAFVVEWQNASTNTFDANFYGDDGRLVRHVSLGPQNTSQNHDAFRQTHQAIERLGASFVLRAARNSQPATVWRYSPEGVLQGCARPASSLGTVETLRGDGVSRLSLSRSNIITLNPFSLDNTTACQ